MPLLCLRWPKVIDMPLLRKGYKSKICSQTQFFNLYTYKCKASLCIRATPWSIIALQWCITYGDRSPNKSSICTRTSTSALVYKCKAKLCKKICSPSASLCKEICTCKANVRRFAIALVSICKANALVFVRYAFRANKICIIFLVTQSFAYKSSCISLKADARRFVSLWWTLCFVGHQLKVWSGMAVP